MLATSVPLFAVALGLAPLWVGVLVALPNGLPVLLAMTGGRWIDRGGAGRWLAFGTGGMATAPLLLVLARPRPRWPWPSCCWGVPAVRRALASQSFVADLANGRTLERNYATYATLLSAGRLVGPLLAGVAIDAAGFRPPSGSRRPCRVHLRASPGDPWRRRRGGGPACRARCPKARTPPRWRRPLRRPSPAATRARARQRRRAAGGAVERRRVRGHQRAPGLPPGGAAAAGVRGHDDRRADQPRGPLGGARPAPHALPVQAFGGPARTLVVAMSTSRRGRLAGRGTSLTGFVAARSCGDGLRHRRRPAAQPRHRRQPRRSAPARRRAGPAPVAEPGRAARHARDRSGP
jgi:hypothetical protein